MTDPSGAAISGAKVSALSLDTGLKRETQTNAAGLYNLVRLPVGNYDLTVESTGFRSSKRAGIRLAVGALTTLDVKMELGSTQESVTVTSEVPLVESTRSQTSSVVNEKAVSDLPINGRNFLDFALLTPVRQPRPALRRHLLWRPARNSQQFACGWWRQQQPLLWTGIRPGRRGAQSLQL